MESFFTNSWTIGIGGGIISGLIVFLVTSKIFSRRENKEYLQKTRIANNELLYAIRPLVVEQKLPTLEILNSILVSTAKKYNVQITDLYDKNAIADDLTKEVMDNSFLTSENKIQYCKLTEEIKQLGVEQERLIENSEKIVFVERDRIISKEFFSLTLAVMTTLTVGISIVFASKDKLLTEIKAEKLDTITLISLITIIPIIALTASKFIELIKERERRKLFRTKLEDFDFKEDFENSKEE